MAKKYCPKCGMEMYATGGGCNYQCPYCNYHCYEAPPRVRISHDASDRMREISSEMRRNSADLDAAMRNMKAASRERERREKQRREAEKQQRKAQKKQEKKGISLGTIIGIIVVLWFFSQFLS